MPRCPDLLASLPGTNRRERAKVRRQLSDDQVSVLMRYGAEYFDGPLGYGGYVYDGRWAPVAQDFIRHYGLPSGASVLDVGCAKGFLLYEFHRLGMQVAGIDISDYAVANAPEAIRASLHVGSAHDLAVFADRSFDLVTSIDCLHNLPVELLDRAITGITRKAGKGNAFIRVASYSSEAERQGLKDWGVTVKVIEDTDAWCRRFERLGYTGDYDFQIFDLGA